MKHSLVFAIGLLAACSSPSHAQQMMLGARGGINFANQHYTNLADGETIAERTLLLGGVEVDYPFSNTWSVNLQLLYDQKGAHADMYHGTYGTADWTTPYIEVPILAKATEGNKSDLFHLYFFAGPSVGFLIKNSETIHTSRGTFIPYGIAIPHRVDSTADITDSTTKVDLSIVAGAGVSLNLVSGLEFFVDAGYAFGLTNSDNYSWDNAYGIYVYSRDIRLAAGVLFPLD